MPSIHALRKEGNLDVMVLGQGKVATAVGPAQAHHFFALSLLLWLWFGQSLCLWVLVRKQVGNLSLHCILSVLFRKLKSCEYQ